jgi:DNA-binding Lrp family transcriptional regulator
LVDERDFWILSQLRKNPFSSYETLGRGIGLSGKAVKTRIEALEKTEILTSLNAMPAAQIFGRFPRLFFFREPLTSIENLNSAINIDPVIFLTLDVNGKAGVLLYDHLPSPTQPEDLISLLGPVESEVTPLFPHTGRELSKPISLSELKVLRVLVRSLRVPLKDISESSGLSQKIVKKIRRGLLDKGLLQVQPIIQSAKSGRIIMYEIHVYSSDKSVLTTIRQTLPKSVFLNQWESTGMVFSCWADSIAEVYETERRLRSEHGVSNVLVKFHVRAILVSSRLISWIDEEILRMENKP